MPANGTFAPGTSTAASGRLGCPVSVQDQLFAQGQLGKEALELRQQLAWAMLAGGFQQHPFEWWHFDQRPLAQLKGHYPRLDT